MKKRPETSISTDGVDRRGFLECMAWAGTGVVWTISGGIATSKAFGQSGHAAKGELTFVQVSDSHIGFNRPANPDVNGTLQRAVDKINALDHQPEFLIHTGDLSHTSKAGEFDMIAVGRALLADPGWVNRLRVGTLDEFNGYDAVSALARLH